MFNAKSRMMIKNLKFIAEDFITCLPAAYYSDYLDLNPAANIYNFEVNALPYNGVFELEIKFKPEIKDAEIGLRHNGFRKLVLKDNRTVIQVNIDHRLLSFDIRVNRHKKESPLDEFILNECGAHELEIFKLYKRDTNLTACNLTADWTGSYKTIMEDDFPLCELENMRDELTAWIAGRQVMGKKDPHYGAIYSEEDKYCFRDAIFPLSFTVHPGNPVESY